jgi:hypothetical protein
MKTLDKRKRPSGGALIAGLALAGLFYTSSKLLAFDSSTILGCGDSESFCDAAFAGLWPIIHCDSADRAPCNGEYSGYCVNAVTCS